MVTRSNANQTFEDAKRFQKLDSMHAGTKPEVERSNEIMERGAVPVNELTGVAAVGDQPVQPLGKKRKKNPFEEGDDPKQAIKELIPHVHQVRELLMEMQKVSSLEVAEALERAIDNTKQFENSLKTVIASQNRSKV